GCAEGPLLDEFDNFDSQINVEAIPQSVGSSSRDVLPVDLNIDLNEDDSLRIYVAGTYEDNQEHSPIAQPDANQGEVRQRKYKTLSNDEKRAIYNVLLQRSENGELKRNTTKERIWSHAKGTPVGVVVDVRDRRLGNSGRKRIPSNGMLSLITTLRSLAEALKTSHRTIHKRLKEGLLRRHSNAIKPFLTEEHKIARLKFCVSMLDPTSVPHAPRLERSGDLPTQIDCEAFLVENVKNNLFCKASTASSEITASRVTAITELQPSPVSVLDSSFYKEESSPSPVMKRTIDFKVLYEANHDSWRFQHLQNTSFI
ncbi:hypothetical protein V2J09_021634, partial [Rumex salicifolius]